MGASAPGIPSPEWTGPARTPLDSSADTTPERLSLERALYESKLLSEQQKTPSPDTTPTKLRIAQAMLASLSTAERQDTTPERLELDRALHESMLLSERRDAPSLDTTPTRAELAAATLASLATAASSRRDSTDAFTDDLASAMKASMED
jgi:hypothetical protein